MRKKVNPEVDPEVQIEEAISKSEKFLQENGKKLLTALCAVVIVIGGYFGYEQLVKAPKAEKAIASIYNAELSFGKGEFELALNGDQNNAGFIEVADKYASTAVGNIANHYAGICYMKLENYNEAIVALSKFKDVKGAEASIINAQNKGIIGDAYSQLKDYNKAISYYEKAISISDNSLTSPYFLMKAAGVYKTLGNNAKALECYETIKNKYFNSIEARDIDKYIGQLTK